MHRLLALATAITRPLKSAGTASDSEALLPRRQLSVRLPSRHRAARTPMWRAFRVPSVQHTCKQPQSVDVQHSADFCELDQVQATLPRFVFRHE